MITRLVIIITALYKMFRAQLWKSQWWLTEDFL